ncbi:sugar phosphate nucleotidyltransferase [Palleronia abyssalis]|uniref:Glucose-1-phosphate adenylyltransferase n=1 Tax=Palleronia abyssalis TaxID=1501240 RepID=A0A2R8BR15_9RHOB|nr:sugar phosphate nucleotidyltransferase [Palleronia abyssalis]SPJ22623.1 Glucose-1-phosphate adenylyltransferase [Palleronia abyssalis]
MSFHALTSSSPFRDSVAVARDTLPVLLAGGRGSRLYELTETLCKPAVPFIGRTRIVDFTMENLRQARMDRVIVATQYQAAALHQHLIDRWQPYMSVHLRHAPTLTGRPEGSRGTADAVRLMIDEIDAARPREVLILAADHVYKMDYNAMIRDHRDRGALVTVAADSVPRGQANAFGVIEANLNARISRFVEKPSDPPCWTSDPTKVLASMGLYIFDWPYLRDLLLNEADLMDFGHDVLPHAVAEGRAYVHAPAQNGPFYWRDVGTLDALRCAALDFMSDTPPFSLPDPSTDPVRLGYMESVVMDGSFVSAGALLSKCIVSPGVVLPFGTEIGMHPDRDARHFRRTEEGTILVTPSMIAGLKKANATYLSANA